MIFAVDIDGTVLKNEWPEVGPPVYGAIEGLVLAKSMGHKIILWTCRTEKSLEEAVEFIKSRGVIPDAVNENLPEVVKERGADSRKIHADFYLDDKSLPPFMGWPAFIKWLEATHPSV